MLHVSKLTDSRRIESGDPGSRTPSLLPCSICPPGVISPVPPILPGQAIFQPDPPLANYTHPPPARQDAPLPLHDLRRRHRRGTLPYFGSPTTPECVLTPAENTQ